MYAKLAFLVIMDFDYGHFGRRAGSMWAQQVHNRPLAKW